MLEKTIHQKRLLTVTNIPIYNKQTNLMVTTACYLFTLLRLGLPLYFRVVDPLFCLPICWFRIFIRYYYQHL